MDYLEVCSEEFELNQNEQFIVTYKAAAKAQLSREQLAGYMGMQPHSLMRKRLKIADRTGLLLETLELSGDADIPADVLDEFEETIEILQAKRLPERIRDYEVEARYVITSAQNATPIEPNFFKALLNFCDVKDAELLVIPLRYRNPTSIWTDRNQEDEWWHPTLEPYLHGYSRKLGKSLEYMGHIKIVPTAVNPLVGFESYTGISSGIIGHPKIELRSIATPSQTLPKLLMTTGSITRRNFTDSKAGHKGAFHHSLAAVVVEIDINGHHHMRHVHWNAEKNGFYDLDSFYGIASHRSGIRVEALLTGDSHAEFLCEEVEKATYIGPDSMMSLLRPRFQVKHDVDDFYRRNHHHRGNDVIAYGKHHFGRNNVERGLQITADYLDRHSTPETQTIVVRSNHDEAFDRWLQEADPKRDPENSKFYYYMKYHQLDNIRMTDTGFETFDAFAWWCFNPENELGLHNQSNITFLKRDESFEIKGIEVGFHGDDGTNGGKGSTTGFSKIGPKVFIGHSHSPGIKEGAYQLGLSAKRNLEYAKGPSSWMHTHGIIYEDGTRTLIHIIDGEFRGNF